MYENKVFPWPRDVLATSVKYTKVVHYHMQGKAKHMVWDSQVSTMAQNSVAPEHPTAAPQK